MLSFGFIDINEVVLDHFEVFGVALLQILNLIGVLLIKLELKVIIRVEQPVHVLLISLYIFCKLIFGV